MKQPARAALISDTLRNWKTSLKETEEEDEDDLELEQEDFDEKEDTSLFDFEKDLFAKIRSLCRKWALKQFDKNTKFSKRERELLNLIPEIGQPELEQLGQAAFFKKHFERITKGIIANVLREIPMIYKGFRRALLSTRNSNVSLEVLEDLVSKDKNSRLHPDELFPVRSNQKYNDYLKEIADLCGIKRELTTHIARHTFATTITLANDVPIESVSSMLGHKSIRFTFSIRKQDMKHDQLPKNEKKPPQTFETASFYFRQLKFLSLLEKTLVPIDY